ncbi:hypothetical protein RRG08_061866 [Elysia crispata]|uniref:Uncharacterized protein n=1 Tax=Elysia crispata TaxID=231223 RepID=A0AAE0XN36_9GAST|nr:hypothetical protein RRG08_061866 [Elysia crispata]
MGLNISLSLTGQQTKIERCRVREDARRDHGVGDRAAGYAPFISRNCRSISEGGTLICGETVEAYTFLSETKCAI